MNELPNDEVEYKTEDQGFAAYLMTKFIFLDVEPTETPGRLAFLFVVPVTEKMDELRVAYDAGVIADCPQPVVLFNKARLLRQYCRRAMGKELAHGRR